MMYSEVVEFNSLHETHLAAFSEWCPSWHHQLSQNHFSLEKWEGNPIAIREWRYHGFNGICSQLSQSIEISILLVGLSPIYPISSPHLFPYTSSNICCLKIYIRYNPIHWNWPDALLSPKIPMFRGETVKTHSDFTKNPLVGVQTL